MYLTIEDDGSAVHITTGEGEPGGASEAGNYLVIPHLT
jgi:hypothetical protein